MARPGAVQQPANPAGQPLRQAADAALAARLGSRFDGVRVHTDAAAASRAAAARAHAVALGNDISFGAGRWLPHTPAGAVRLAHELVHVEQQRIGRGAAVFADAHGAEAEARTLAPLLARGAPVQVRRAAPHALQRDGDDAGSGIARPAAPQLRLEPVFDRLLLRAALRWWLGTALTTGDAPTAWPPAGVFSDAVSPTQAGPGVLPGVAGLPRPSFMSQDGSGPGSGAASGFVLAPSLFQPLPADPLFLQPDVGALFTPFGERGAPVGPGDSSVMMDIYRRNQLFARGLPDLRAMAPAWLRPVIPGTWRRDIAGALTGAAIGAGLNHDFLTPIELSDRAFQNMTGASTTVVPPPSVSFDLF